MTMNAAAIPAATTVTLRFIEGGRNSGGTWWQRRTMRRSLVGGCPDHWWKPTAPRTAACTCDRF